MSVAAGVVAGGFFYVVLPRLVDLGPTLRRMRGGDGWWLALAVVFEVGCFAGQAVLLRGVFGSSSRPLRRGESVEITLAGTAATKVVGAAGAGGIAVTAAFLRSRGLTARETAGGMVCYGLITYGVYMAALVVAGLGLRLGVFSGPTPFGLTVIPALGALAVIAVVLSMLTWDRRAERALLRRAERSSGRRERWLRKAAAVPRTLHDGLVAALAMVKRRDPSLLGAIANWGFDIGALWASFHAFGHSPPGAVLVMSYFLGTLGTALPVPGGVGGVEGGMIGASVGFGVDGDLAVIAVLTYRTISYWLPAVPGAIAYWRLQRRLAITHSA